MVKHGQVIHQPQDGPGGGETLCGVQQGGPQGGADGAGVAEEDGDVGGQTEGLVAEGMALETGRDVGQHPQSELLQGL